MCLLCATCTMKPAFCLILSHCHGRVKYPDKRSVSSPRSDVYAHTRTSPSAGVSQQGHNMHMHSSRPLA